MTDPRCPCGRDDPCGFSDCFMREPEPMRYVVLWVVVLVVVVAMVMGVTS